MTVAKKTAPEEQVHWSQKLMFYFSCFKASQQHSTEKHQETGALNRTVNLRNDRRTESASL